MSHPPGIGLGRWLGSDRRLGVHASPGDGATIVVGGARSPWAVIGSVVTVIGLRVHRAPMRLAGLALLGVVTMKVFVVDLAALDIAYRVLSFAALGVLLLAAAYLYSRMQPQTRPGAGGSST